MTSTPQTSTKNRVVLTVVGLLAAFIAVIALPDYLSGGWPWTTPPESPHLKTLLNIREDGITLPGWQAVFFEAADFGGDRWSVQQFAKAGTAENEPIGDEESDSNSPENGDGVSSSFEDQIVLLLRPQATSTDQPEVEWIDLMGAQRWTVDSQQRLTIAAETGPVTVNFARAWNDQQTYAIAQWYAWPNGGHPTPGRWFWGDQLSQWQHRERLSWIAVSLLLPMPPLSAIETAQPRLDPAVKTVQNALQTQVFNVTNAAS